MNINFVSMHKLTAKTVLKKGFTLVEVLIVILIIALLMAFIIPQVLKGPAQARDAVRIADVNNLALVMDEYRTAQHKYPQGANGKGCFDAASGVGLELVKAGFLTADKFPEDPDIGHDNDGCAGKYAYHMVSINGVSNAGVVVYSTLETPGRATANQSDISASSLTAEYIFGQGGSNKYYHQVSGL